MAKISENQTQSITLQLAELYFKLNSKVPKVCFLKVKALIEKEWDPENYIRDIHIDPMTLGSWNLKY